MRGLYQSTWISYLYYPHLHSYMPWLRYWLQFRHTEINCGIHTLTSILSALSSTARVASNIDWNNAAALEFLGAPGLNKGQQTQIQAVFANVATMIYSYKNPFQHYIKVRCDDPSNLCQNRPGGNPCQPKYALSPCLPIIYMYQFV
jgi:hypothetical protein